MALYCHTSKVNQVCANVYSRFFGKTGTPYDFAGVNLGQAREQCRELEAAHKGMGRKINTKVMNMIDK